MLLSIPQTSWIYIIHYHSPTRLHHPLPRPNRRPRRTITPPTPININLQPRIRILIRPREAHQRPRRPTPPTRHANLRARNIKLRAVDLTRPVQRNVLDAQKILAARRILGDSDGERRLVERRPAQLPVRRLCFFGVDLEPDVAGAVPCGGCLAGGDPVRG